MFTITKEFHFSAAHRLSGLPDDHQCARLHGHNYRVIITLAAPTLNDVGFVRDYGELKIFKQYLDNVFDHRDLNDVLPNINPTAENLAEHLWQWAFGHWPETEGVTVCETPTTTATFATSRMI